MSIFNTVVKGDYCVGCGMCEAMAGGSVKMKWTGEHRYVPEKTGEISAAKEELLSRVCPFGQNAKNEDQLSTELFRTVKESHPQIGRYIKNYAGHVVESDFRKNGSSGGMATWIAVKLLEKNLIDAVIHVGRAEVDKGGIPLFSYRISKTKESIKGSSKSRYYPINLADVFKYVRENPGSYAIVGVPCFIKAVRLAALEEKQIEESVKYCIGIVCGHLKSGAFAELLGWQAGVEPDDLRELNFREKLVGRKANSYGFRAIGEIDGKRIENIKAMGEVRGGDWGMGFFKLKSCDYCDDVVAETADVAIGDAWLPAYTNDSNGTNVVIIRNEMIAKIIDEESKKGSLNLDVLDAEDVVLSQRAGLRHRREGLAYRLGRCQEQNEWHPPKRVLADRKGVEGKRRKIYDLRVQIAERSHKAFARAREKNDISLFFDELDPLVKRYQSINRPPLLIYIMKKVKHYASKFLNKI